MYCIQCGVHLADTEARCPLCETKVYHPEITREPAHPLYPPKRYPDRRVKPQAFNGAVIGLCLIVLGVAFVADWQPDRMLGWFYTMAGALLVAYVALALPLWFRRPNPVIFVPCAFAAAGAYLGYLSWVTGGGWFLAFALPVTGGVCLITSTVVTLLRYLRRGRLYLWGGAIMALGGLMLLTEFLMTITWPLPFTGWSFYPLVTLVLLGGFLLYLAINRSARKRMERKFFF